MEGVRLLSVQICTIMLIISVMLIYHRQLYIKTESNYFFEKMLFLLLGISVIDIIINMWSNPSYFGLLIAYECLLRLFNVLFVLYVFAIRDYVFYWIKIGNTTFSCILRTLICVALFSLPVSVSFTGYMSSYVGVGIPVTYEVVFAVVVYLLIVVLVNRKVIQSHLKVSIFAWIVLLCCSMAVNSMLSVNFMSFACAVGSLWLFYAIENPKSKIDDSSGFFTSHVIFEYLDSMPDGSAHVGIIYTRDQSLDVDLLKGLLYNTRVCCFKDIDAFYYLVSQNIGEIKKVLDKYAEQYDVVMLTYKNATADVVSLLSDYVKRNASKMSELGINEISDKDVRAIKRENDIHAEVMDALLNDRIETYIQPIYDLKSGMFVSGECLCRLKCGDDVVLLPAEFIPVAEHTGLITEIETVMFRNMCKCLSDPRIRRSTIRYLEANLSIKKGEQETLLAEYASIVDEYGVDMAKVNLEITETDVVEEKRLLLNNMHAMRSMGFHFSLDDFGTGESNIGYIIDMPVSIIKFDKEITQKAIHGGKASTIVSSVINMAHDLDMKIVVEGVETESDFQMCKNMGVDLIQGYYFSKPLPVEEFIRFIVERMGNN